MRRRIVLGAACALSAVLALAVGLIVVLVLLDLDTTTVGAGPARTSVRFGAPIAWITQDETGYGRLPSGTRVGFASPMEHPTTVSSPALAADVGIVAAVLAAGTVATALGLTRLTARRRSRLVP